MKAEISVLVAARKNSKYLAKFLFNYFANTVDHVNTEILVMLNAEDTWNRELVEYFEATEEVKFFYEDYGYGRNGLHVYFNDLLKQADGDWFIYFCEDHSINTYGWDSYVRQVINGGPRTMKGDTNVAEWNEPLDHNKPYCLVPKFDNAGAMNHILSKGYVKALGGVMGRHGWIDSYINDLNRSAFEMPLDMLKHKPGIPVILFDDEMFHDFTHDQPSPMHDSHMQSVKGKVPLPDYKDKEVQKMIERDAERLRSEL